jgi:arylsulfatase A-like enzyme
VCDRTVDFMSIFPTLCDLAGIPVPSHAEGANIRSLLADPKAKWDKPAITTFHQNNHSLRTEKWRYIRYANGDEELYDHDADPYEWTNLATDPKHAQVKAELAKGLPKVNHEELPRTQGGEEGKKAKNKAKQQAKQQAK